ncbi:ABC transporter permease [Georgenia sp. H159]|uniref:ABC transporter permease n=1 Tax=Georgenia sp. H159 TaxID=3076115 RepID=UPI002D78C5BD|nr:ABC transporter permease [Georgenia sp. H159]
MAFVIRRVLHSAVVLLGVSVLVFAIVQLVPGDPVRIAMGTRFDPDVYARLREASGLDRPLVEQYVGYLTSAVTGDLGVSFRSGEPVTEILLGRLPATVSMAGTGILIALVVSFPLGLFAALRHGRVSDTVVRGLSQFGVSIPDFWMAMLFILLFSSTLGWLPPSGYVALTEDPSGWARRVVMPALTIGLVAGSILTRYIRSSVLEVLAADHVRTARSKGLRNRVVIGRHIVRNALIPVLTITGNQLATMLGGVVVVEVVFAWPGLGRLIYDAVLARDYPLLQGSILLVAAIFLLINLLVDLLYGKVDPRIRVTS